MLLEVSLLQPLALLSSQKGFERIVPIDGIERIEKISDSDRFSVEGQLSYNVQYAHFKTNQIESKGPCDLITFNNEFEAFKWAEQLTEANKFATVSPILSLRHNRTQHEMGISVVGNNAQDYGFWILFGKQGAMGLLEVILLY